MTIELKDRFYTLEKTYFYIKYNIIISMAEHDMQYRLKPAALLNLLQDMGARNIYGTSFGNQELNAQNLGWFLVRYRIEFDNYPKELTEMSLRTENRGTLRQTAYRSFEAFTPNGERILRALSSWLMVDLDSKSLINIEQKFPDITRYEKREDDLTLRKLKTITEWNKEKTFHVRYEDLDMNGHVNNTIYMSWAIEALDMEYLNTHNIKNIDIYFKHEVRYGDDIISLAYVQDDYSEHLIKIADSNEEVCLIRIEYA